tara:strand:+ start:1424 stop:2146 length:723 start_codon:yes stop_codon:yes gene_type:complete
MSTLRVDNIKSRTGTQVNIPAGQSLVVSGIGSIVGELKVGGGLTVTGAASVIGDLDVPSGNLSVGGNLSLTGSSSFNLPSGIGTFGQVTANQTITAGDSLTLGTASTKVFLHGDNISNGLQIRNESGTRFGLDGPTPNVITADGNIDSNKVYFVDTSSQAGAGGSITVTLPQTPVVGDYIQISDYKGTWSQANCVVKINAGSSGAAAVIHGKQEDLQCNVKHAVATLTYTGISSTGWIVK